MTYYGAPELARSFRTVRGNTIRLAEDIPEDKYAFRPVPESRSVAELLAHIALSSQGYFDLHVIQQITTFVGVDFMARAKERTERELQLTAKADILAALRSNAEAWGTFLDSVGEDYLSFIVTFPEPLEPRTKSRFELLLSVKEHEMHHRAQLMLIERLLGIVPHLTRDRLARMNAASR